MYLRIEDNGICHTTLITAKTRVAPVKPVSLPRLELCGAALLANLMEKAQRDLNLKNSKRFFWTDSMITLNWIQNHPNKYKTFVANRIDEIQRVTKPIEWRHVPTKSNPADLNSRGITVSALQTSRL